MAYTLINDLPLRLVQDLDGEEYLLLTTADASYKLPVKDMWAETLDYVKSRLPMVTGTYVTDGTLDPQIIDIFDKTLFRSGEYFFTVSNIITDEFSVIKVLLLQDGTVVNTTTYGMLGEDLCDFSFSVVGGFINLEATPKQESALRIDFTRFMVLAVGENYLIDLNEKFNLFDLDTGSSINDMDNNQTTINT